MERKYRRLKLQDRELIGRLQIQGLNQSEIAQLLGVNKSTISRELKRNKEPRLGYIVYYAQNLAEERRAHYRPKIESHPYLLNHVVEKLKLGWSPQQIAGRSRLLLGDKNTISHETIYNYVFSDRGKQLKLYTYLRSRQKRRFPKIARKKNKRSLIPNRVSIHDRPAIINKRDDFGHWEADLIVFSYDKKANIFTMRERKSRYLIALKNQNRSPTTINQSLLQSDIRWSLRVKSITFDNDFAFRKHEQLAAAFTANTYFCDPFKSHQKGSIENVNRVLREYCPRKMDIAALKQEELSQYTALINDRPMKCLGYRTPKEVYFDLAIKDFHQQKPTS